MTGQKMVRSGLNLRTTVHGLMVKYGLMNLRGWSVSVKNIYLLHRNFLISLQKKL